MTRAAAEAERLPLGPSLPFNRLRADPRYLEVRTEMDRESALSDAAPRWRRVEELTQALLEAGAADLLVAAYAAVAAQSIRGIDGLALGVALIARLHRERAEGLGPPRPRARAAALRWWLERALRELDVGDTGRCSGDDLAALAAAIDDLGARAAGDLGDEAPTALTRRLARRLREVAPRQSGASKDMSEDRSSGEVDRGSRGVDADAEAPRDPPAATSDRAASTSSEAGLRSSPPEAVPEPPVAAPRPVDPPAPLAEAAPSTSASSLPGAPSVELDRQLRRTADALIEAARSLRAHDLRDPRAFQLLREGLWLRLDALPPNRGGASGVARIDEGARARLDALASAGAWPELIEGAEALLPAHRLDLDLQRRIAEALLALTPPATGAADVILDGTRALVARLPGLVDLRARDGAPLADAETRRWLARPSASPPASDVAASPRASRTGDADDAAKNVGPGDPQPGADTHATSTERGAFHRRLERAESALRDRDLELAAPLFAGLVALVRRHALERWEPALALRALVGALRSSPRDDEARKGLMIEIGALDPDALAAAVADAPRR
ncbi:MAG: type VI secretion system domain-containing protein [Myxococcales bacterium]|nr:type VI secretion system domain-containing protein [Myxococcales bacterium]